MIEKSPHSLHIECGLLGRSILYFSDNPNFTRDFKSFTREFCQFTREF